MRRNTLLLCVGAVTVLAAGCQDAVVAPNRSANSLSASSSPSLSRTSGGNDRTLLGTLELSPNGGTYSVGGFDIVMPAGAVCDPRTTKYGPKYWDEDCTPATASITVNVVAVTRHGEVSVDFQPDLRFRPSAGDVRIQTSAFSDLLTTDAARALPQSSPYFNRFVIFYVPTGKAARIDEVRFTGDPSMITHIDRATGIVWRRVKHFSGYYSSAGYKCDPSVTTDTSCQADDPTLGLGSSTLTTSAMISFLPSVDVSP